MDNLLQSREKQIPVTEEWYLKKIPCFMKVTIKRNGKHDKNDFYSFFLQPRYCTQRIFITRTNNES